MRTRVTTLPQLGKLLKAVILEIDSTTDRLPDDPRFPDCLGTLTLALHAAAIGADQLRVDLIGDASRYSLDCTPRPASHTARFPICPQCNGDLMVGARRCGDCGTRFDG